MMMESAQHPARPKIVVTRELSDGVMARMAELFDATLNRADVAMNRAALEQAVAAVDVLVPTITDTIDAALIAKAGPRLKLIANFGVGVDHIDLHAARERGIIVTNTPGVLTEDTADMTMALILSVPRRLGEGEKLIRGGIWDGWKPGGMLGHRVNGKTLGIIGMGRIGRAVARRAQGFGMRIAYHNRHRLPDSVETELNAIHFADLDAMLPLVDIVTVNCPHTPETHHLMNARRLSLMRSDAYFVNTARGDIVDENALIMALQSGAIAGAGLDVYAHEPDVDPRLLSLANTVLLPHMGSATYEGRAAMGEKVIANIRAWADGHRPPDQVLEGWS
jgi:glyoxylate reductase